MGLAMYVGYRAGLFVGWNQGFHEAMKMVERHESEDDCNSYAD